MRQHIIILALAFACACHGYEAPLPGNVIISDEISNYHVNAFTEDSQGFIWIGTARGLNRFNSREYRQYFHNPSDSLSLASNAVTSLFTDSGGRLWVGTYNGACVYDAERDNFRRLPMEAQMPVVHQIWETPDGRILMNTLEQLCEYDPSSDKLRVAINNFDPSHEFVNECHDTGDGTFWSVSNGHLRHFDSTTLEVLDDILTGDKYFYSKLISTGVLWLATNHGTKVFDTSAKTYAPLPGGFLLQRQFGSSTVTLIHEIYEGVLLVNTDNGIYLCGQDGTTTYEPGTAFPSEIPVDDFSCMFTDSRHDLWIGSKNHGVSNIHSHTTHFRTLKSLGKQLSGMAVSSISTAPDGKAWIATSSDRIFCYEPGTDMLEAIDRSVLRTSKSIDERACILYADREGRIWMVENEVPRQLHIRGGKVTSVTEYPEISQKADCIAEDISGTIWIGASTGNVLYRLRKGGSKFEKLIIGISDFSMIYKILPLEDGRLALGLARKSPVILDTKDLRLTEMPLKMESSQMNLTVDMTVDTDGNIWVGTRNDGVFRYDPSKGKVEKIQGLPCEETAGIVCDNDGDIWISTLHGICRWKRGSATVQSYFKEEGTGGNQFNEQAAALLSNGMVAFGGAHGISLGDPGIVPNLSKTDIFFEDLKIGGVSVAPGNRIDKPLTLFPEIRLSHRDNHFSISCALLDYAMHGSSKFWFRLEGYDDNWTDNGDNPELILSNIPAGKYTLEVRSEPTDLQMDASYAAIPLRIKPALWNTWWAWCLYVVALLALAYAFYRNRINILKEKEASRISEMERRHERKINEMNMSFFANISHEFRTPLTLISGPVIQLAKTDAAPELVRTLRWNVSRMLRLVNQLMDFNKLEDDSLKLGVSRQDVVKLLSQTADAFRYSIEEKGITMKVNGLVEKFECWTDVDKLDKIVSNLLSNAMKYTPVKDGVIVCGFDVISGAESKSLWSGASGGRYMKVTVADNGPSIPENSLERIFERYYQVENHHNYGTGIGLYFARRLAILHHGWLRCDNLLSGGTVFTLLLPADDVYSDTEKAEGPASVPEILLPDTSEGATGNEEGEHDKTVMVVDDDPGIVNYLKSLLSTDYNVLTAFSGESALELIRSEVPDLVVSDVAMPGMDGYELCRTIKEDSSVCHIPVILVTAKTTVENQIEGLKKGADAYVTKPFDPDYLMAMIDGQLANRERLHGLLGKATDVGSKEITDALSPQDSTLMKELYQLMESELSNAELNINSMTERLYISRSKLYYKIKALTGDTPNIFFKKYKLNRAIEMLDSGKYNISEVADLTGFSSLTVFGRNFKAQFGHTPSEYLSRKDG